MFVDLLQSGWFDRFTLTAEQGEEITKLLDAGWLKFKSKMKIISCLFILLKV